MHLFNEILVSMVIYCYIIATDYNEIIEMRDYSGYGILGIIGICITVNILKFLFELYLQIKLKTPSIIRKCREKRRLKIYDLNQQ